MATPGEWDPENDDPTNAQKKMIQDYYEKVKELIELSKKSPADFGQLGTGAIGTGAFVEAYPVRPEIVSVEKIENGYMVQTNPMMPHPVRRIYCLSLSGVSDFLISHFEKDAGRKEKNPNAGT
jgi:hypothetical protein